MKNVGYFSATVYKFFGHKFWDHELEQCKEMVFYLCWETKFAAKETTEIILPQNI